jgi:hypothetical protein
VLYDRSTDPAESVNLASDPAHHDLVAEYNAKLEALIDAEIGDDTRSWVTEQPQLLGWPTWRGDTAAEDGLVRRGARERRRGDGVRAPDRAVCGSGDTQVMDARARRISTGPMA